MQRTIVRQVGAINVHREMEYIRNYIVDNYPYVTMRPILAQAAPQQQPEGEITPDTIYARFAQDLNTGRLRLFQLGLTFSDEHGNLPIHPHTREKFIWEFHVKVANSPNEINADFRQYLTEHGINVDFNLRNGIHLNIFATKLWRLGLFSNEGITWVGLGVVLGFASILKVLWGRVQDTREGFLGCVRLYFPRSYDVWHLMVYCGFSVTLDDVASLIRWGVQESTVTFNQGGRGSLMTLHTFLALKRQYFPNGIPQNLANVI